MGSGKKRGLAPAQVDDSWSGQTALILQPLFLAGRDGFRFCPLPRPSFCDSSSRFISRPATAPDLFSTPPREAILIDIAACASRPRSSTILRCSALDSDTTLASPPSQHLPLHPLSQLPPPPQVAHDTGSRAGPKQHQAATLCLRFEACLTSGSTQRRYSWPGRNTPATPLACPYTTCMLPTNIRPCRLRSSGPLRQRPFYLIRTPSRACRQTLSSPCSK